MHSSTFLIPFCAVVVSGYVIRRADDGADEAPSIKFDTGIFDSSCEQYRPNLDKAVASARSFAVAGYQATRDEQPTWFTTFFPETARTQVRKGMRNIARYIDGHSNTNVKIKCLPEGPQSLCRKNTQAYAYVELDQNRNDNKDSYVNLCASMLDVAGQSGLPWTPDLCVETDADAGVGSYESIARTLFHELLHIPELMDGLKTKDRVLGPSAVRAFAQGRVIWGDGDDFKAIDNAPSWVEFAGTYAAYLASKDAALCPGVKQHDELRKLLWTGPGVQVSGAAANGTITLPGGDGNGTEEVDGGNGYVIFD